MTKKEFNYYKKLNSSHLRKLVNDKIDIWDYLDIVLYKGLPKKDHILDALEIINNNIDTIVFEAKYEQFKDEKFIIFCKIIFLNSIINLGYVAIDDIYLRTTRKTSIFHLVHEVRIKHLLEKKHHLNTILGNFNIMNHIRYHNEIKLVILKKISTIDEIMINYFDPDEKLTELTSILSEEALNLREKYNIELGENYEL